MIQRRIQRNKQIKDLYKQGLKLEKEFLLSFQEMNDENEAQESQSGHSFGG